MLFKFTNRQTNTTCILFYVLLIQALYYISYSFDYNLDDEYYLSMIPKDMISIWDCFEVFSKKYDAGAFRPINALLLSIEYYIKGNFDAGLSHKINVFVFTINVILFHILLRKILLKYRIIIVFSICILFALHPIHANVVSSIKNRDILLSFMFSELSLLFFIFFIKNTVKNYVRYLLLIFSILFASLALISKADSYWLYFALPIIFLYYQFIIVGINIKKQNIIRYLFLIIFILFSINLLVEWYDFSIESYTYNISNVMLYTENPIEYFGFMGKLYFVLVSIAMYSKFFLFPGGYHFYFGYEKIPNPNAFEPLFLFGILIVIVTPYIVYRLIKLKRYDILGSLVFLFLSLGYAMNIITPVSGIVDPRLAYHASAGFCTLLVLIIYDIINKNYYFILIISLLSILYFYQSNNRIKNWENIISLLGNDMPYLKKSFQANRIASYHYLESARYVQDKDFRNELLIKGLESCNNAISLDSNNISTQEGKGIALNLLGNTENAIEQFEYVIEKFDTSEVAWDMLGDIYYNLKRDKEKAAYCFKNTIRVSPNYNRVYYKYTGTMYELNKYDDAKYFLEAELMKNKKNVTILDNIGYIYLLKKDTLGSFKYYKEAYENGFRDKASLIIFKKYFTNKKDSINIVYLNNIR
jgi:tetratricopeptide (TPR) repeat protein